MILKYSDVKSKNKTLMAMTSLNKNEFEELCIAFDNTYKTIVPRTSARGRPAILSTPEDRLFFILFYLKTYPLQEVIAHLFGMSQEQANYWIHLLSRVLTKTLGDHHYLPQDKIESLLTSLADEAPQHFGTDATERRIVRPANDQVQGFFYSGKKGCHTVKNTLVAGLDDRQIKYLGETHEGKKHDKTSAEEAGLALPNESHCYLDLAYLGFPMEGVHLHLPHKKPRGGSLTAEQVEHNRLLSGVRVVVEHVISGVKRLRVVKDVFRNLKANFENEVMVIACGLHNFRSAHRLHSY